MKFDKTGKFIKSFGRLGSGPGELKGRMCWRSTARAVCS